MRAFFTGLHLLALAVLIAISLLPSLLCAYNWLQYGGDPQHTGVNYREVLIQPGNVGDPNNGLKRLYQVNLPSPVDGPMAYLSNVATPNGQRDILFGTTMAGGILALDAHSGAQLWAKQAFTGTCIIRGTQSQNPPDGYPCVVHSAAAVDPNLSYVYSYSLDGKIHKYRVGDGTEIVDASWPEVVTLKPDLEKASDSLVFATARNGHTYLYAPFASYPGDWGEYQGHIVAIDLASGAQKVFNMLCSDQAVHFKYNPQTPTCVDSAAPATPLTGASVWGRASLVYLPGLDRIYTTTANGNLDPSGAKTYDPLHHNWASSVIALNPDGSGASGDPLDSYTPTNFGQLTNLDMDLGSSVPAILPVLANSKVRYLGLQSGKDGKMRLLNLENLSGQGGPGHLGGEIGPIVDVPIGDGATQDFEVRTTPLVWVNPADNSTWVFLSNDFGLCAFKLVFDNSGNPSLSFQWKNPTYTDSSSPQMANGVIFLASATSATAGIIRAIDPLTGSKLWSDATIGTIHWSVPVVANGVVYITDQNAGNNVYHLTAYSLKGQLPQVSACSTWLPIIFR